MEISEYYALSLSAAFALVLLPLLLFAARWLRGHIGHDLHCLLHPLLPPSISFKVLISRYEFVVCCSLLALNILYVTLDNDDIESVVRRLGHMALVNLVPTSCGAHMNQLASICGIHHDRYFRFHAYLGVLFVAEAILHTAFALQLPNVSINSYAELIALSSVCAIFVSSILHYWFFELFSYIHTFLASAILVALWLHLPSTPLRERPRLYILLCSVLFISIKTWRYLNIAYLSFSGWRQSMATIEKHGDSVEIRVRLARPLKLHAGQYIYLSLWGLSSLSAFEYHPFQICWEYADEHAQQVIVLLAQARRGFSRRLLMATPYEHRALIEGPYGKTLSLGQYGTVLLFATDMGIAGQLPYIRKLLEQYQQCKVKTRRIALFWELEDEGYRYWVKEWMNQMLSLDSDYVSP
ncbi:hypothetical protein PG985_006707 [Apiospora marii]|uniref:ferric-chelate reductase (NADPH) n=1 Tax=Apiospora marii TaxID=335849 RepID=A0ABR1S8G1_9PEZI